MSKGTKVFLLVITGVFIVIMGAILYKPAEPTLDPSWSEPTTETTEQPKTFHGYSCTSDCSGHEAGYDWAKNHDICDPKYDKGNSNSFNEGVRAYAYDTCYYSDNGNPL